MSLSPPWLSFMPSWLFLQSLASVFFQKHSHLGFQPRWEREKELISHSSSLKITQLALLRDMKFLSVLAPQC